MLAVLTLGVTVTLASALPAAALLAPALGIGCTPGDEPDTVHCAGPVGPARIAGLVLCGLGALLAAAMLALGRRTARWLPLVALGDVLVVAGAAAVVIGAPARSILVVSGALLAAGALIATIGAAWSSGRAALTAAGLAAALVGLLVYPASAPLAVAPIAILGAALVDAVVRRPRPAARR